MDIIRLRLVVGLIGFVALTGCDRTVSLEDRCIEAAVDIGYNTGRCANYFIDQCIETQDKAKMKLIAELAGNTRNGSTDCPNMGSKYVEKFNSIARARNRF